VPRCPRQRRAVSLARTSSSISARRWVICGSQGKSGEDFDGGDETEALRLAVTLRTLLYNKKRSTSLLKQLGVQHQLRFRDTASPPERPMTRGAIPYRFDAGLAAIRMDGERAEFVAPLEDPSGDDYGDQPFRTWWKRPVLEDLARSRFTREELVLFMAHKVGGAHVDTELPPHFVALTKLNSLGWGWTRSDDGLALVVPAGPDDEPMGNPIPSNVRQIAWEVQTTVEGQLDHLLSGS
jgi:hypothetical protein